MAGTRIAVVAYAGYQGEQEPRALVLDGVRLDVLDIADRWYDPAGRYFKVRASDGRLHLLRCDAETLEWSLVRSWTLDS
jgi:hypothetical protein